MEFNIPRRRFVHYCYVNGYVITLLPIHQSVTHLSNK